MTDRAPTSIVRLFPVILACMIGVAILIAWFGDQKHNKINDHHDRPEWLHGPEWLQNLHQKLEGKSHWERVVALRSYAHRTVDMGKSAFYMDFATVDAMSLATLHEVFRNDLGAVMCGGKSMYLMKLYRAFGYKAWSYDVGERYKGKGGASHQFNLVEIPFKGDTIISVQDAYLNITYANTNDTPLDFFQLLQSVSNRQCDDVVIQPYQTKSQVDRLIGLESHSYNDIEDTTLRQLLNASRSLTYVTSNHPAGFKKERMHFTFKKWLNTSGDRYLNFLASKGYPRNFLYLFLFPKSIIGPNQEQMRARIDSIVTDSKSVK